MTYYAARLSFFETAQKQLTKKTTEKEPIALAGTLLMEGPLKYSAPRNRQRGIKRGFMDFYVGNYLTDESSQLLAFKIGRLRPVKINKYSDKKFKKIDEEDYPNATVIWVEEQQVILIEKLSQNLINIRLLINSFEDHLNKLLRFYELQVSIALLTDKSTFWDIIYKYKEIYDIEFILFAPNFIGDFNKDTREILAELKNNYNASRTALSITNENGNLVVKRENPIISKFLDWIKDGGGEWNVKVKSEGKKTTINSTLGSKSINLELDGYDVESVKNLMQMASCLLAQNPDD